MKLTPENIRAAAKPKLETLLQFSDHGELDVVVDGFELTVKIRHGKMQMAVLKNGPVRPQIQL